MRILHFGDLHVWDWTMDWSDCLYPKRWLAYVNLGLKRRKKFPPEHGQRIMKAILEDSADVVISSGDFSTGGLVSEFAAAAKLLDPIHEKWGDRFFAIPGNHDRYTPKVIRTRRMEEIMPYTVLDGIRSMELDERTVLIGFDVCVPCMVRSNGVFDAAREQVLRTEFAKHAGKDVILVCHYPYATVPEHPESWEHKLIGEERLAEVLAELKPLVYLHGHKHVRWALRSPITPETLCLNCGSAGMTSSSSEKMAGFVTFDVDAGSVSKITAHTLQADSGVVEATELAVR